jgi:hypothetical protein
MTHAIALSALLTLLALGYPCLGLLAMAGALGRGESPNIRAYNRYIMG